MSDRALILTGAGAVLALAIVGFVALKKAGAVAGNIVDAIKANKDLVNPLSTKNLAYQGANAVAAAVTGNTVDTIGTAAADRGLDPTQFSQADLERIVAAGNHYGREVGGWTVG